MGLMSLFSAEAGARKVYCIEGSQIASAAEEVIRRNGKSSVVTVIRGRIEEAVIPEGKVDVIISEWMGYFLHYEDMVPAILTFRDKYLSNDGGLMFPSHARMWASLYSDAKWYDARIRYWEDVYGFDYTPLISKVVEEQFMNPERQHLRDIGVVSEPNLLHSIDMYTATLDDVKDIRAIIDSKVTRNATIHGIAFWFDVLLEGDEHRVLLDTSPKAGYTSWSQVVWYVRDAFNVTRGQDVKGSFAMLRTERGEFDVAVRLISPSRVELEAFDQSPSTMFQNLYERLSFEHGIYEGDKGRFDWKKTGNGLVDIASRLQLGFIAAGVSAFAVGWMVGRCNY
uniref:Protein arginine N-methyltransferase domain-containing protein n=1 Tax=Lotharella oceanica TaxID=641309 RepID=A0A7S2X7C8_9EUKA